MKCRHCDADLKIQLIDLGSSPPSNSYLTSNTLHGPEKWYPLRVLVCDHCWLVQTEDFVGFDEMFSSEYAYFSSYSETWLKHAREYVCMITEKLNLDSESLVIEIAANDGYLLQFFKEKNIPSIGIEPTESTANAAKEKGIDVIKEFFGKKLALKMMKEEKVADLIIANNVLAHVPNINDFISGFAVILKADGCATFEFPHLLNLMEKFQFDTIYHEHYSYLSLTSVVKIFKYNGLSVVDVEEINTHGGSLRVYAKKTISVTHISPNVGRILKKEKDRGFSEPAYYSCLQKNAVNIKNELLLFLLTAKKEGKKIAAYGAAAKGNTLLNYSGIRSDMIEYVVDKNIAKQGKYLPGSRIPIVSEEMLKNNKPDYIIILPWNIKHEIQGQLQYVKEWGARFVTCIPRLEII